VFVKILIGHPFKYPLPYAVKNNYSDIVEVLLETSKTDPNPGFQAAMATWQIPLVRIFLSLPGVDPNIEDRKTHKTPLMTAICRPDLEMVQVLLQSKTVDINAQNSRGETALMCATRENNFELVRQLVEDHGADTGIRTEHGTALDQVEAIWNNLEGTERWLFSS
jgi:ankyrin repeat protein